MIISDMAMPRSFEVTPKFSRLPDGEFCGCVTRRGRGTSRQGPARPAIRQAERDVAEIARFWLTMSLPGPGSAVTSPAPTGRDGAQDGGASPPRWNWMDVMSTVQHAEQPGGHGQLVSESEPADGRAARSHRSRRAIVNALRELHAEGDLRPTAPRVAERAG